MAGQFTKCILHYLTESTQCVLNYPFQNVHISAGGLPHPLCLEGKGSCQGTYHLLKFYRDMFGEIEHACSNWVYLWTSMGIWK